MAEKTIDFFAYKKQKENKTKDLLKNGDRIKESLENVYASKQPGGKPLLLRRLTDEWENEAPNKLQIVYLDPECPNDKSLEDIVDCIEFEEGGSKSFPKYGVRVTYTEGDFYVEEI
ncbi:MAG TPA: hypothetical protein P5232_04545 [Candidatus Moranbacteria bacterium]|nr:hypothetical protein [Candidatus Moranbacteria bacterium]